MPLTTFAFLHDAGASLIARCRAELPAVEFLQLEEGRLPAGLDRAEAAAISWEGPPIDAILAAGPRLEWLHQRGAGIDRIATPALRASRLVLTNGSGNHAPNIAEHLLALMLAFARQLPGLFRAQQERRWSPPKQDAVFELSEQTLAIAGTGAIGTALAQRAKALGMRVHGLRRTPVGAPVEGFDALFAPAQIDAFLADADHVAVTLPLTDETRGLFGSARFAAMKRGVHVYNVGRGPLIDQDALLAALRSGQVAGAGLDVTDPEPLPADSPLWTEPGVIVTAHSSGITPRSAERHQALFVENLLRFSRGEPLLNVVDKTLGY